MAHKAGTTAQRNRQRLSRARLDPFESERQYCASLNALERWENRLPQGRVRAGVTFCGSMASPEGDVPLDVAHIEDQAEALAVQGYRVIALAGGEIARAKTALFRGQLSGLTFLGLVGIIDPLRTEAKAAVTACRAAGIEVAMVTGDHPITAATIARSSTSGIAGSGRHGATAQGAAKRGRGRCAGQARPRVCPRRTTAEARDRPILAAQRLFRRRQRRRGQRCAGPAGGTGRRGHGQSGTDVARETADIIMTDDNFASIVGGVEEGRIAYANVRKVIFLLISTGAAELVLFRAGLILTGLPLPLLAVQLLWLNLVTNGIQDVALAFEPGEGDELRKSPGRRANRSSTA
jgi:Ca2+-transporting ATPase